MGEMHDSEGFGKMVEKYAYEMLHKMKTKT